MAYRRAVPTLRHLNVPAKWTDPADIAKEHPDFNILEAFRATVDMRPINNKTKDVAYPMPVVEERVEDFHRSDRASVVDVEDAFFMMRLRQKDRHKTAFRTPFGLMEW